MREAKEMLGAKKRAEAEFRKKMESLKTHERTDAMREKIKKDVSRNEKKELEAIKDRLMRERQNRSPVKTAAKLEIEKSLPRKKK